MRKSPRQRAHPQGTNAHNRMVRRPAWWVPREAAPDLSRDARRRLGMLDWHRSHGSNVSLTARHYGVGRSTVYRWLGRYDRFHLETLENRGSAPHRRRRPTWPPPQLQAVPPAPGPYPRWGKDKLRILLRRAGMLLSTSMVGRILSRLLRAGDLHEPRRRRMSVRQRRWQRPYAIRTPAGWGVPGRLAERMPFPIRAISIDNGSEFMAEFETACAEREIRLFVLPPRSPKLHGAVERANRTHTEEFYEVTDAEPELAAFQLELRAWETVYNTIRPHQSLGYLTPAEYLASVGIDVYRTY